MNSSQTKWLVGLALALFAFIAFDELRRPSGPPPSPAAGQLVPRLRPATVTRIEVTLSNATIRAEFAAGQWRLTAPLSYPADPLLISALLEICSSRRPQVIIPAAQVKSPADFGLQPPQATVRFHQGDTPIELRIGARTPVNNQIYLQVAGSGDIAIADANLLGYLPQTADAWRDRALLPLASVKFDRLRVRTGARDLLLQAVDDGLGCARRRETHVDRTGLEAGQPGRGHRRQSGHQRRRLGARYRQRLEAAGLDVRHRRARG